MTYIYPDKDDKLTCQLIDTEYNGAYWQKSEEQILSYAIEQVRSLASYRRGKNKKVSFLDLGCGMGRLIPIFAGEVDEVTAVEPDSNRFEKALMAGKWAEERYGHTVNMVQGDAESLPSDKKYSIILSSHVLQHIKCEMADDLMLKMSKRLEPGGLLLITTTYTAEEDDLFFKESWKDGMRSCEATDEDGFNEAYTKEGILPVRQLSEKSIMNMAQAHNLDFVRMDRYHYKGHQNISEDAKANLSGDNEGARDVLYIFKKRSEIDMDANICYHFSFSTLGNGLNRVSEQSMRSSIKSAYPNAIFGDDELANEEPLFRDLSAVQGFLHAKGLPFECFRVMFKDYDLEFETEVTSEVGVRKKKYDIQNTSVFMSVFPDSDTVQVCVCLSVKDADENDFVHFRHMQGNGAKLKNKDGRMLSIRDIFREVSESLKCDITDIAENYIIEIKRFSDEESVAEILNNHKKLIYGLMTGDEGWKHVPEELAESRLENSWGSRDFMKLISFGANSVFFNLSQSEDAKDYRKNRADFDHSFYGDMDKYFSMDSNVAGVNHGVLLSFEMVMVIRTICNRILRRQADYYGGDHGGKLRAEIQRIKAYRGELITTLSKVENLAISEVGEMEKVLLVGQQIDPIIDKIKYLLELLESELNLLYDTSTNRLGNWIAIGGLIFAAIQIMQGFM